MLWGKLGHQRSIAMFDITDTDFSNILWLFSVQGYAKLGFLNASF